MDIASLVGMLLGLAMIIFGIVSGEQGVAALVNFIHIPSFLITFGGSLAGVIGCNTMADFINGLKGFTLIFKSSNTDAGEVIKTIIDLSNVARKEGLLALDEASNSIEDPFLKKGVMLVVELVRGILETDLVCIEDRHKKVIALWEKWAELGPAWGMIGTLIGLINMLKLLDDPNSIGPNMSTALITTLYGSFIANWLCNPVASKLKVRNAEEIMLKEVTVEGLLSIQAGENPRVIEEKLKSFLSPKSRDSLSNSNGGEG